MKMARHNVFASCCLVCQLLDVRPVLGLIAEISGNYLDMAPAFAQSYVRDDDNYAPQSGEVFSQFNQLRETSEYKFAERQEGPRRPVSKVIALLKMMMKQLEKEADQDEEIYEKMQCWCETNAKEKTRAIDDGRFRVANLKTSIEAMTAKSAQLNTERKDAKKEASEDKASLDSATALRIKQKKEFDEEEKSALQAINALKAAITVIGKHHSFLQIPKTHLANVAASVRHQLQKHASLFSGVLTRPQRRVISSFAQMPEDYLEMAPVFAQSYAPDYDSYAPQSGEVFGIIKQMRETFESNLADSTREEITNQKAYEELRTAKLAEIKVGKAQISTKTQEIASTDGKVANDKEDRKDTSKVLAADERFYRKLKESCTRNDAEYQERTKTRQNEMEAVSKALAVLSSDDAHDQFTKAFNPSLLQKLSSMHSEKRLQASALLLMAAQKTQNPRLSTLAVRVRLDAFTKVKKAIDDMVAQLLEEKKNEIKLRNYCVKELHINAKQREKKNRLKLDLISKIEDVSLTIKQLAEAIASIENEISEMEVQLKRAGEDREKENREFQETIADQRNTQRLLRSALKFLNNFYKRRTFLQQRAQPKGFKEYKDNGAARGVTAMIEKIIYDSQAMEKDAMHSEQSAQKAYETFVMNTNDSKKAKRKDIVNKSESKAKAEAELMDLKKDKSSTMLELEQLSNKKADLHQQCDFVLKNFEIRQTARDEEVESLKQAKAVVSGADFKAFLQRS